MKDEKNKIKYKSTNKNSGITLLALVVTIIILLILAGVSIAMLAGENGILTQAIEAKKKTEIEEIKERVKTDILGLQMTNQTTEIEKTELKEILDKYFENVPEDYTLDTEIIAKTEYRTYKLRVSDLYNGTLIIPKIITSQDIANATDKSEYYGATVINYELPKSTITDVGWKIFYADVNNIFLLADNYVERTNLPNSTTEVGISTNNKPNDGDSKLSKTAYFANVIGDYAGSERIKEGKIKTLNNDYFFKNYSSTNNNIKAVAYMMDTTAWNSKFKDINNKAEYAIGGPTIEMIVQSYSQKHKVDYRARAKSMIGYEISTDGGKTWENYIKTSSEYLDVNDSLYVINSNKEVLSMWLASPSAGNDNGVMLVRYDGILSYNTYRDIYNGFRPLVCLKSDVQLQENRDGTYTIL